MVLVLHSSKFHHWPLLALLVAQVLHKGDSADFIFAILQYDHCLVHALDHLEVGLNIDKDRQLSWRREGIIIFWQTNSLSL